MGFSQHQSRLKFSRCRYFIKHGILISARTKVTPSKYWHEFDVPKNTCHGKGDKIRHRTGELWTILCSDLGSSRCHERASALAPSPGHRQTITPLLRSLWPSLGSWGSSRSHVCPNNQRKVLTLCHQDALSWTRGYGVCCPSAMAGCHLLPPLDRWETPCSGTKRSPVYFGTADYCQT